MLSPELYSSIRAQTLNICKDLNPEDTVAQAAEFTSPPKWHLAHSTWFFETFVLKPFLKNYRPFNVDYDFLFNSYYETLGKRVARNRRGLLSRPLFEEILAYRAYVDRHVLMVFETANTTVLSTIELGLQHEQQHQELLVTDTKYFFFQNPLLPHWQPGLAYELKPDKNECSWLPVTAGLVDIGYQGSGFCFDNELAAHQQYVADFEIASKPVTNADYLKFIEAGGYQNFSFWLADGWNWLNETAQVAPLYWLKKNDAWWVFGFEGLQPLQPDLPVMHLNYYEAEAFARWSNLRLPTEAEHETAARSYPGFFEPQVWEWTQSAYLPYPGFKIASGAVGEYNGKFMSGQMVLRGASIATPEGHSRVSYRNFFSPHLQWQFSGLRLVKDLFSKPLI